MIRRYKELIARYGTVALAVYLCTFLVSMGTFSLAIATGFDVEGVAAGAGTFGAAYLATKAIQPLRIGATLALTPVAARLIGRRPEEAGPDPEAAPASEAEPAAAGGALSQAAPDGSDPSTEPARTGEA